MGIDIANAPDSFKRRLPQEERRKLGRIAWTQEDAEKQYTAGQEKQLQDDIEMWLYSQRPSVYYTRARMDKKTTTRKGTPDFICCVDRRALYIEAKTGANRLIKEQEHEMIAIKASGGLYLIAYDLHSVIKVVRHLQAEMRYVTELLGQQGYKFSKNLP